VGGGRQTDAHAGQATAHSSEAARPACGDRPLTGLAYLAEAAAAVAAVRTASDLSVLAMLESAPAHPANVAEQLGLSPRGTGQLLETLATLGLLSSTPEGYAPSVARSAQAAAAAHIWDALPEMVRTARRRRHRRR
jgi:hypothetical protein